MLPFGLKLEPHGITAMEREWMHVQPVMKN